jgi:hypothetical protein
MKVAGCSKLSLHPLTGYWFRAVAALSAHPGLEGFVFPSSKSREPQLGEIYGQVGSTKFDHIRE